jgi:phage-related baseplate assembly protein
VRVLSPVVVVQAVEAVLTIQSGFVRTDVIAAVESAISNYINNLGISGDVVVNELIEQMMAVDGMFDMNLVSPTANTVVLDNEIARIQSSNIDLS